MMTYSTFITVQVFYVAMMIPVATGVLLTGVINSKESEHWSAGSHAVSSVLGATLTPQSSVIIIIDGSTSSNIFKTVINDLKSPMGITVFKTDIQNPYLNRSTDQLIGVVEKARLMRESSWHVTIIVFSGDSEFIASYADASFRMGLMVWSSKLLLVTDIVKSELQYLMQQYWTLSMMNTVAIQVTGDSNTNRKCKMYARLPYTLVGGGSVVQVATWTNQKGLMVSNRHELFPQKYRNFYGSQVNVTMWPFMPYFMSFEEVTGDSSLADKYTGRDYMMLETIAHVLNFTIYRLPTAGWDEVMLKVMEGVSFISPMKMSVLPHLLEKMDFTIAYEPEKAAFALTKPSRKPRWQNLYYPLADLVWALILALLFILPFVLFWIDFYGYPTPSKLWAGPWVVFQEVLGTLLGQPLSPHLPSTNPIRILMVTWITVSFIIETVYRGSLTAFLTIPKYPSRIETLPQFLEAGTSLLMPPDAVDFYNSFKQSPPGDYRKLSEHTYFVPNISVGFARVQKENVGYMYERRNMELNIARYYTKGNGWTPFYVAKENLWPGWSGWPIIKGAPYKPVLDRYIRRISEAGLLEKWDNDVTDLFKRATRDRCRPGDAASVEGDKDCDSSKSENTEAGGIEELELGDGSDENGGMKPLTIVHLQGPLLLLVICLLFCSIIFIFEASVPRCLHGEGKVQACAKVN